MTLSINNLTGGYSSVPVLNNLDIQLKPGEIVGLIGLNGAGKSTLIKHIIGIMHPFEGNIIIDNHDIESDIDRYRRSFTYIPEMPILYEELTLREHIEMTAMAYGIPLDDALNTAEPLLRQFRLWERLDWLPIHFSKGMKQKVMIINAFLVEAPLYIVDEPFLGLDPLAIHNFIEMIKQKRDNNGTVLMSTHILTTAEQYCDRFIFLHEGQVRAFGTIDEIRDAMGAPDLTLDELYIRLAKEQEHAI